MSEIVLNIVRLCERAVEPSGSWLIERRELARREEFSKSDSPAHQCFGSCGVASTVTRKQPFRAERLPSLVEDRL